MRFIGGDVAGYCSIRKGIVRSLAECNVLRKVIDRVHRDVGHYYGITSLSSCQVGSVGKIYRNNLRSSIREKVSISLTNGSILCKVVNRVHGDVGHDNGVTSLNSAKV